MAHYLAESICELAAPPLQPSLIRIAASQGDYHSLLLLLHVRPRRLAAGIEVAVYSGLEEDDMGAVARIRRQGIIYAVRQTQAGLEQFVADLIASSPAEFDEPATRPCKLGLYPWHTGDEEWDSVQLDMLPPSTVRRPVHQGPTLPSADWMRVTMPSIFSPDSSLGDAEVRNRAADYAEKQAALKRQMEQHKHEQAAAGTCGPTAPAANSDTAASAAAAAPPQPDSETKFERKWRALRDESMAELQAALLAMLRQALRFRGTLDFPLKAPPIEAAAAAADDQP
ncbi:hypothetical protein COHA_007898 [Chlorella ohadii]|uniref:Uncharacterized protein n=1 Tax=Chlorella ohadii TaxID=2649997 RepID=A0AAD5DKZ0_9CHLO|nr:hypothetical protein COHA_007898 [Chlorella ohadii]